MSEGHGAKEDEACTPGGGSSDPGRAPKSDRSAQGQQSAGEDGNSYERCASSRAARAGARSVNRHRSSRALRASASAFTHESRGAKKGARRSNPVAEPPRELPSESARQSSELADEALAPEGAGRRSSTSDDSWRAEHAEWIAMLRSLVWQSRSRGAWPPRMNRSPGATHDIMVALDAEMTQIDPHTGHIMEVGVAVVTPDLVPQASLHVVVHTDQAQLKTLSAWSSAHHAMPRLYEGGLSLIELCSESTVTLRRADEEVRSFLDVFHQGEPQRMSLCGNSVWRDLLFVQRYLPRTSELLHHRVIDSSGARELARRHCHVHRLSTRPPRPLDAHCAMYDALDAVNFLRWHSHLLGGGAASGKPLALASLPVHAHRRIGFEAIARLASEGALPFPPFIMMPPVDCGTAPGAGPGGRDSGAQQLLPPVLPPPAHPPQWAPPGAGPGPGCASAAHQGFHAMYDAAMRRMHSGQSEQPTWCRWGGMTPHHMPSAPGDPHAPPPCGAPVRADAAPAATASAPHAAADGLVRWHARVQTPMHGTGAAFATEEDAENDARSITSQGSRLSWAQRAGRAASAASLASSNNAAEGGPVGTPPCLSKGAHRSHTRTHARNRAHQSSAPAVPNISNASYVGAFARSRLVRAQGAPGGPEQAVHRAAPSHSQQSPLADQDLSGAGAAGKKPRTDSTEFASDGVRSRSGSIASGRTVPIPVHATYHKPRSGVGAGALTADALAASVMGSASARAAAHSAELAALPVKRDRSKWRVN